MQWRWLGLALLVAALLGACNQERNESIRLMNKGLGLFKQNKLTEALHQLDEAGRIDPSNERAFFYKGLIAYQKLGRLDEGEQAIRRAIEINGGDAEFRYHLGTILAKKGEWRAAISELEQGIKVDPEHAESHLRLGISLERTEQYDRAQSSYVQAIKLNPRLPEAYNALGNLYRRFDQISHAAQVFRNGVENNPAFSLNYHDLGLVYQAQKRFTDAIRQFKRAQTLDPGNAGALFNLGMTYAANDDPAAAIKELKVYLSRRTAAEDGLRVQIAQDTITRLEASANR
jgi:tetratricopeptide (TPR) repeat protein